MSGEGDKDNTAAKEKEEEEEEEEDDKEAKLRTRKKRKKNEASNMQWVYFRCLSSGEHKFKPLSMNITNTTWGPLRDLRNTSQYQ
ncbi:hypothetical protein E2C01_042169 [Portunus trituberculatus]|uniref:Uncharacterized protein n=1 Tax=Portunus trituberculatus TaxID=210409 RepID=A0A5B7FSP1_PORTR|nr:hypothetical protein [Portunus trituberculatus]